MFLESKTDLKPAIHEIIRKQGKLLNLSMINPDIQPPQILVDRLMEATNRENAHRYTVSRGIEKLRRAFTAKYRNQFDINIHPEDEVCVTRGSKEGIALTLRAVCSHGEAVLIPTPTYPAYTSAIQLLGLNAVTYTVSDNEEALLEEIVTKTQRHDAKAIVLNFPNNPTGVHVSKEFYAVLEQQTRSNNLFAVNDFVYGEMAFSSKPFTSLLNHSEWKKRAVEVYSLSKAYSIPGWRMGAVLGTQSVVGTVSRYKSHSDYGTFQPLQEAAAHALHNQSYIGETIVSKYNERARSFTASLAENGWQAELPAGGASIWLELPPSSNWESSYEFSLALLDKYGIAVLPGSQFGAEWSNFIRVALVASSDALTDVATKIVNCFERRQDEL